MEAEQGDNENKAFSSSSNTSMSSPGELAMNNEQENPVKAPVASSMSSNDDAPPALVAELKENVPKPAGTQIEELGSFSSEIERLSKDADAILDSIRFEVASSPSDTKPTSASYEDETAGKVADDYDWDDDMSDELGRLASASEEIAALDADQEEAANKLEAVEIKEAEAEVVETKPVLPPQEKATASTPSKPAQEELVEEVPVLQVESKKEQEIQVQPVPTPKTTARRAQQEAVHQVPGPKPLGLRKEMDQRMFVTVILVWFVIFIHVMRAISVGLLNENGRLILPFCS